MKRQEQLRLGNYWIIKSLGRGGFADVYLGEHISLRTLAAIKVLHAQPTREKRERFWTEAYITAKLSHRHIVQILDFDEESSSPFLIMKYAPNGSLDSRYRGEKLPLPMIVSYVKQISKALDYVHRRGVIHCDVKPNNMLLDANDDVLLTDFGIAVLTDRHAPIPRIFAGTAMYMAPEQYKGRPLPASDQYSLGIMVYEWLSGYPPFFGSSSEIVMQHVNVPPPSLNVMAPRTPPAVQRVVSRALEKDPYMRFSSVGDFALALERASQEVVEKLTPVSSWHYQSINHSPDVAVLQDSNERRQRAIARQRQLRGVPQQRIYASQRDMLPASYVSRHQR
jgi:eukaryotic-like serine/threonine-protein kinase